MRHISPALTITAYFITAASAAFAQNSILVFDSENVRSSTQGTGFGQSDMIFNSSPLLLNCGSGPVHAVLSSTPDGTGNVLVDNFINLTVTTPSGSTGPVNICRGGVFDIAPTGHESDCFTVKYRLLADSGTLNGKDSNSIANVGGVTPIDISSALQPGPVQVKIDLVDTGGFLASSSIYLNTSCTQAGVTGPGKITGNPIPQTNPPPSTLTQTFSFDSTTDQQVEFVYDLSVAQNAGQLTIPNNSAPITSDIPIDPSTFQSTWVPGTSFATSNCLVHTGELLPSGQSGCKLLTLQCQVGTGANPTGAQCPASAIRNEIFQELFDGPAFTLPDVAIPSGPTFHQGIGFLMAKEDWPGGPCVFDAASGLSGQLCPQNLLTDFSGPGRFQGTGIGDHPNSSFITVAPVLEDLTTVTVEGQHPGGWINNQTATVNFSSQPPDLTNLTPALPGQGSFVPSPIKSITYGIASTSAVPQPSPILLIPTDTVITSPTACPAPATPGTPPASIFAPSPQTVAFPGDGQFFLHYFAQDCAGTEELKFTQDATSSWSTSFFTIPVNIDTVTPVISGITLSPAPSTNGGVAHSYSLNQHVTATYSCSDDRSGIVICGTSTFAPGTTLHTAAITSPVDTSSPGTKSFVVNVADAAGNHTTAVASYQVVAPTVNLDLLKVAPATVRHNDVFVYDIVAENIGGGSASNVVVTDHLPAGVTFLSATPQIFSCSLKGCSNSAATTHCSFAANTVTCTANTLDPLSLVHISAFTIEILVRADASTGTISNTASITSANPDSHPGGNHSTAITRVVK
ncbi:MAG TPA: DUF11 domain-containing protein [Edaphobacter sp.]|nr:DUF11 domain-containing protein [Edaphobacter sp.]